MPSASRSKIRRHIHPVRIGPKEADAAASLPKASYQVGTMLCHRPWVHLIGTTLPCRPFRQKRFAGTSISYAPKKKETDIAASFPPTTSQTLSDAFDDERRDIRALGSQAVSIAEVRQSMIYLRFVIIVNHDEGLTLLHLRTHLANLRNTHGWV